MDLWQLRIFCKLIELRSFSRAGEAVRLSQPTVSSHIKDLEEHFGAPLVDRLARGVQPTEAGKLLYDYATRLIALREETETAMAEFLGKVRGHLNIGGSTIPGGYLLPRVIGGFCSEYPGISLALTVSDTADILARIDSGRIEVGVVGARSDNRQLKQVPLLEDEVRLVLPRAHRWASRRAITIEEMITEPFIVRERGSGTLGFLEQLLAQKGLHLEDLKVVAEMGSTEAVRQAIKSHVGVSILSAAAIADDLKAGALHGLAIEGVALKRSFYLTRHRKRSPSPLCRAFMAYLENTFPGVSASAATQ